MAIVKFNGGNPVVLCDRCRNGTYFLYSKYFENYSEVKAEIMYWKARGLFCTKCK